ncbi:reverse transcriptase [Cucumis melo var. makuwa]|uniref:Reverse transcriptase n=1 Tax=Cucumis melo var. makuwa TaxID=1194695 RepID=A0A5D3DXA1_CUCMM|nr:reverse transcriptase [Cucumis melo var. makuwa]
MASQSHAPLVKPHPVAQEMHVPPVQLQSLYTPSLTLQSSIHANPLAPKCSLVFDTMAQSTRYFLEEKLNGQNYYSWSKSIKVILEGHHKFGFLIGYLKESYPSICQIFDIPLGMFATYVHSHGSNQTKLITPHTQACVFVGYPLHQWGYKYFHPSSRKYFIFMDVTFLEDHPFFFVSLLQGGITILPTNQVPQKTYYKRNNLKKDVRFETNSTNTHINSKVGENDGSETVVPEDMLKRTVLMRMRSL